MRPWVHAMALLAASCSEGPVGRPGDPGPPGAGVTSSVLAPGEGGCAAGGVKLVTADGEHVVCNGPAGPQGTAGVLAVQAPLVLAEGTLSVPQASSTQSGVLAASDYARFDAKVDPDDARLTDARAPLPGSAHYVQNRGAADPPQAGGLALTGGARLGGDVTIGGQFNGSGAGLVHVPWGALDGVPEVWPGSVPWTRVDGRPDIEALEQRIAALEQKLANIPEPWFVDVRLSGADYSLGSNQSAYAPVPGPFTLHVAPGSAEAALPCASGAPATTTCSGNAHAGVAFDISVPTDVRVCAFFSHDHMPSFAPDGYTQATFKLSYTAEDSASEIVSGRRVAHSNQRSTSGYQWIQAPIRLCDLFSFDSPGRKVIRLFHTSYGTNYWWNRIVGPIHLEVYPLRVRPPAAD